MWFYQVLLVYSKYFTGLCKAISVKNTVFLISILACLKIILFQDIFVPRESQIGFRILQYLKSSNARSYPVVSWWYLTPLSSLLCFFWKNIFVSGIRTLQNIHTFIYSVQIKKKKTNPLNVFRLL